MQASPIPLAKPLTRLKRWVAEREASFFFYFASRISAGVLSIFTLRAIVAYMPREEYAEWGYLSTLSGMLVPIVSLSLPQAMMRYYFDHKDDEVGAQRSLVSSVLWLNALGIALLALGALAFFALGLHPLRQTAYFAGVTSAAILVNYFNYLTRTRNDYGLFLFNRVFEAGLFLLLVIWASSGGPGAAASDRVLWLTLCLAATSWLGVLCNLGYYGFRGLISPRAELLPGSTVRGLVRFSLPLSGTFFAGWVLSSSDIYLLNKLGSKGDTADYVFAVGIVSVVSVVSQSALLDFPRFFFKLMRDSPADRDQRIARRAQRFLWLHVATIAGTRLIARYAYEFFGAEAYTRGIDLLSYLLLGNFLFLAGNFFSLGLSHAKRTHLTLLAFVIPGALNFGLNLVLIPKYGALAAAATTLGAYALFAAMMLVLGGRYYRFEQRSRFLFVAMAAVGAAFVG